MQQRTTYVLVATQRLIVTRPLATLGVLRFRTIASPMPHLRPFRFVYAARMALLGLPRAPTAGDDIRRLRFRHLHAIPALAPLKSTRRYVTLRYRRTHQSLPAVRSFQSRSGVVVPATSGRFTLQVVADVGEFLIRRDDCVRVPEEELALFLRAVVLAGHVLEASVVEAVRRRWAIR